MPRLRRQLQETARSKIDQQMLLNLVLFTKGADDVRLCIETLSPAGQSGLVYLSANGHALHAEAKRICLEHLGRRHARHRCAPRPCCSASPTPRWRATTGPRTLPKEQYLFDKGDAAVLSHTQERPNRTTTTTRAMARPRTTRAPTSGRHAKKPEATLIEHGLGNLSLSEDSTDDDEDDAADEEA